MRFSVPLRDNPILDCNLNDPVTKVTASFGLMPESRLGMCVPERKKVTILGVDVF